MCLGVSMTLRVLSFWEGKRVVGRRLVGYWRGRGQRLWGSLFWVPGLVFFWQMGVLGRGPGLSVSVRVGVLPPGCSRGY